jgi:uncharacterized protein (TIGR03437 family)
VEQTITVSPVAPALFLVDANRGAVINRDGSLNSPSNPISRGEVLVAFGTGFGATTSRSGLNVVDAGVTAQIAGTDVAVIFAGLTPGFFGLYQINVTIPGTLPPGLALSLSVRQGNSTSNPVQVAVQ